MNTIGIIFYESGFLRHIVNSGERENRLDTDFVTMFKTSSLRSSLSRHMRAPAVE